MRECASGYIATSFRSLPEFTLLRPATLNEAVDMLGAASNPALYAGGTDMCARFNEGFAPAELIDLRRVAALHTIARTGDTLTIGAGVTHFDGARHDLVIAALPGFAAAWAQIANVRIRFAATIGGNVMARRTRYEAPILLAALGATLRFASAAGEFEATLDDVWNDQHPRALLQSISIPIRADAHFRYTRDLRPIMTQALYVSRHGAGYAGQMALATEYLRPIVLPLDFGKVSTLEDLPAHAEAIARETLKALPTTFEDICSSNIYLRTVAAVHLRRQLADLSKEAADGHP